MKPARVATLLLLAFLCGGGSAEVAVRTSRAVARARAEREIGSSGHLVAIELRGEGGEVIASPRLIAPPGRTAQLVLRDPLRPDTVRLTFKVDAVREPSGEVALDYALSVPDRDLTRSGRLSMTPGVEQPIDLGDGALSATILALPVPSAAFEAFLEGEAASRPAGGSI